MSSLSSQGSPQVHYSVTRGASRRDPHYITCLNSDANCSKWKEPGPTVDNTGTTCYWKTDDHECHALSERWKKTLGKTVAKLLGLTDDSSDEDWRIQDFPKDYKLFRHVKGTRDDYYLFGSEWVTKFRTANEFSPHFHWLCTYEPTKANRVYCKCKYCSGLNQGWVNSSLGISDPSKRFSSPIFDQKSASQNKRKAEEEMAKENQRKRMASEVSSKPPRVSQKPVTSRKSLPNHVLNSASNGAVSGRRSTFSGPYVNKDRDRDLSELQCTFRTAELVWCRLDTPIDGTKEGHPNLQIDYWPAICEERVLVSNPEASERSSGCPKIKIQQKFQWKVRLLATSDVYCKDESQLLPYLNYPPPLDIYKLPINPEGLKYIYDGHESDRPTISSLTFAQALPSFALSLQITAHIKKNFTLMDRYDIALLKRLEARGQNIPIEDVQVLYEDSNLPWYQYIWWGAEKIWSGELIRLIVTASDLPTGLRPITSDNHLSCFFLKLTGFYRNAQEEGMAKGAIFELSPIAQRLKDESEPNPEFDESDSLPGVQQIKRYMPEAPSGYFFRRLTPVGKEHHLVLQHIAGRYYPPRHPIIQDPSNLDDSPAPYSIEGRSLILSGLGEGRWLHMHCETWTLDRKECFKDAEASAEQELIAYCNKSGDETIKTKSVTVIESEKDEVIDVVENGMGVVGSNGDIVMEAGSFAANTHDTTDGYAEVDNNLVAPDASVNNNMNVEHTNFTPLNPSTEISNDRQNTVPPVHTELENNGTGAESKNDDAHMRPSIGSSTVPPISNLSVEPGKTVPSDPAHLENEEVTAVPSNDTDVNMEPDNVTSTNPQVASSNVVQGNTVSLGSTRLENIATPAGDTNYGWQPDSNAATSIKPHVVGSSVEEGNAIPSANNQADHIVTRAASNNDDTNLQPNIVTSTHPHIAGVSVEGVTPTGISEPNKADFIDPNFVRFSVEKETPAPPAPAPLKNNVTLAENTIDGMNFMKPNTVNRIGPHDAISVEKDKIAPLSHMEVRSSASRADSRNASSEPSTVASIDLYISKFVEKQKSTTPVSQTGIEDSLTLAHSRRLEPSTSTRIDPHFSNFTEKGKSTPPAAPTTLNQGLFMNAESNISKGSTEKEKVVSALSTPTGGLLRRTNLDDIDPQLGIGSPSANSRPR